jgi:hypothetical protein
VLGGDEHRWEEEPQEVRRACTVGLLYAAQSPTDLLPLLHRRPLCRRASSPAARGPPREQDGKWEAERGELRFSAPSQPNGSSQQDFRVLLRGIRFGRPFGTDSAPAGHGAGAEAVPKAPSVVMHST